VVTFDLFINGRRRGGGNSSEFWVNAAQQFLFIAEQKAPVTGNGRAMGEKVQRESAVSAQ